LLILVSLSLAFKPTGVWCKPQSLLTHGQCDARPAATFLALEHHRPSTSTKLYCLLTEAGVRERVSHGRTGQCGG